MTETIAARLRQLARDHYEGRLAFDAYLRVRGEVLDSLIGLSAVTAEDPAVITQPRRNTGEFAAPSAEPAAALSPAPAAEATPAAASPTAVAAAPVTAVSPPAVAIAATPSAAAPATTAPAVSPTPAAPSADAKSAPAAAAPGKADAGPTPAADPTRRPAPARRAEDSDKRARMQSKPHPVDKSPVEKRRRADGADKPKAAPAPAAAPAEAPPKAAAPPPSRRVSALAIGGIAAIVLGIVLSWLWASGAFVNLFGSGQAASYATAEDGSNAARTLIDDFLLANDWNDSSVAQFNLSWKSLGVDDRQRVFDNLWHRDLVEAVRTRVKEQRALAAGEAEQRIAGPLSELAATFGIDVSAPDRVILPAAIREESPAPSPTPAAVARAPSASPAPRPNTSAPAVSTAATRPATTSATPAASQREAPVPKAPPKVEKPVTVAPATAPAATAAKTYPECIAVPVRSRLPLCQDRISAGGFGPVVALIPEGTFQMGNNAVPEERPVRAVAIGKPVGLTVHEISQAEYKAYTTATGKPFPQQPSADDDRAVVNVNWHDARAYAEWLSSVTGQRYRLPSEAEWEYAARAGETGLYPTGTQLAITDANFSGAQKPGGVASRKDKFNYNKFRLFHTVGNAREWVLDGWTASFEGAPGDASARSADAAGTRVVRGGAYTDTAAKLRLTTRERLPADTRDAITGFRLLREIT